MQFNLTVLVSILLLSLTPVIQAEPVNLSQVKTKIQFYHDSGQYDREIGKVIQAAADYIHAKADHNRRRTHPRKLAVVLDIDETSLSNYAAIVQGDFANNKTQIHNHLLKANDPAIASTLSLYQEAQKQGVTLFFVTGRRMELCAITKKNLLKAGYSHWKAIYCRPETDEKVSVIPFKSSIRKKISQEGYVIIANIGDQKSDLKGGYAEKGFKLPNPFYYLP